MHRSLKKTLPYIVVVRCVAELQESVSSDSDSVLEPKRKKKKRFGIHLFGKRKDRYISSSDSTSSDTSSGTSIPSTKHMLPRYPSALSSPNIQPSNAHTAEQTSNHEMKVATQSDLRGLKEEVMVQREEVKRLEGLYTYLQKEMLQAPVRHAENCNRVAHATQATREEMEAMLLEGGGVTRRRKELLRKKEEKQQELTASLLNHFRSTVESRVKDVQRRVREWERRER